MNKYLITFCLALALCLSLPSFALSKLGHKVVCQLSFQQLSTPHQNKIKQLLAAIPKNEQQRINRYNHQKLSKTISFADSCTWADAIKKSAKFDRYKSWHYMNVPRSQQNITSTRCSQPCLLTAIALHQSQLARSSQRAPLLTSQLKPQNTWQRAQALMFLSHWIADMHQPLHVSFKSDRGGNQQQIVLTTKPSTKNSTKPVSFKQKCTNLHWYWDECLLTSHTRQQDKLVEQLSKAWRTAPIKLWQQQSVTSWANESLALIRMPDFRYCHLDENAVCQPLKQKVILGVDYQQQFYPILEQQLLKASARLVANIEQYL